MPMRMDMGDIFEKILGSGFGPGFRTFAPIRGISKPSTYRCVLCGCKAKSHERTKDGDFRGRCLAGSRRRGRDRRLVRGCKCAGFVIATQAAA